MNTHADTPPNPDRLARSVRVVALFEAAKGALALLSGFGALALMHRDVGQMAEQLVGHLHLNPARHYPGIFIEAASRVTDARLWTLAALSATYSLVRLVEAYGLWNHRRWAEWFAAASGGIYIPFEVYELIRRPSWLSVATLTLNVVIVGLMVSVLRNRAGIR